MAGYSGPKYRGMNLSGNFNLDIDVTECCQECEYYCPLVQMGKSGEPIVRARGNCGYTSRREYKQRTETCNRFTKRTTPFWDILEQMNSEVI